MAVGIATHRRVPHPNTGHTQNTDVRAIIGIKPVASWWHHLGSQIECFGKRRVGHGVIGRHDFRIGQVELIIRVNNRSASLSMAPATSVELKL